MLVILLLFLMFQRSAGVKTVFAAIFFAEEVKTSFAMVSLTMKLSREIAESTLTLLGAFNMSVFITLNFNNKRVIHFATFSVSNRDKMTLRRLTF